MQDDERELRARGGLELRNRRVLREIRDENEGSGQMRVERGDS